MRGSGIFDGDYILVNPDGSARDGDVVAARLGNEGTVKTLAHHGGRVVLEAANPADGDITVDPNQSFTVLGVVCGVFRPFQELEPAPERTEED